MTETEDEFRKREDEFDKRMKLEGDLGLVLCEHVWNYPGRLRLADDEFEPVGCDEVPGYENEDVAALLRRKSDGQVFEADIDVTVRPVRAAAKDGAS